MEELRQKLITCIDRYGRLSPLTIAVSQELDKLIIDQMKRSYSWE